MNDWGTFEDRVKGDKSAREVCCVCGGGMRRGSAPSPASGGSPMPAIEGPIFGTKEGRALQAQGYSGELVEHVDQRTMTEDWGAEFGPHAGHKDVKTICAEHPGNEWCSLHGYYDDEKIHSAAPLVCNHFLVIAFVIVGALLN